MLSTSLLPLLFAAALLSVQVAGIDICSGRPVCFNSFYSECDKGHIDESGTCTFDSGNSYDYSYPGNNGGYKLILADQDYKMSWVGDDLGKYPVRLSWYVVDSDRIGVGMAAAGDFKKVTWDKNITEGSSITIKFLDLFQDDFPNGHTNITGAEALAYASAHYTQFGISQPEHPDHDEDQIYWSDTFFVAAPSMKDFLETENTRGHEEEAKVWRIGVGVGVGVGVPVLLALLGFLIWRHRRNTKVAVTKKGMES